MFWCNMYLGIRCLTHMHIVCSLSAMWHLCLLLSPHAFVFLLMATWCNYFYTDNHLWFTTVIPASHLDQLQLLPNICHKPLHYVYFSGFLWFFVSPSSFLQLNVTVQGGSFWKMRVACLDRGVASPWDMLGRGQAVSSGGKVVQQHKLTPEPGEDEMHCAPLHGGRSRG